MKTFFRWAVRIAVTLMCLAVVLVVLVVLLKDVIAKSLTEKSLRDNTGMDARISKLEIGLATPTVTMEGLKLYNTPQFGGGTFLDMPELRVEYVTPDVREQKLRLKTVRLNLAEVHIIKGKDGKTNLDHMDKEVKRRAREKKKSGEHDDVFGGIDTLYLTVGKIRITDELDPRNNGEFNLGLKEEVGRNLKTEEDVQGWFGSVLIKVAIREVYSGSKTDPDRSRRLLRFFGVRL